MGKQTKEGNIKGADKSGRERHAAQEKAWDKQAGKDVHKELADRARSKNEE